jgi:hypothetical protein
VDVSGWCCVCRCGGGAVLWDHSGSLHLTQPVPWVSGQDQTGEDNVYHGSYLRASYSGQQCHWLNIDVPLASLKGCFCIVL